VESKGENYTTPRRNPAMNSLFEMFFSTPGNLNIHKRAFSENESLDMPVERFLAPNVPR
jgi:hypothetical protein